MIDIVVGPSLYSATPKEPDGPIHEAIPPSFIFRPGDRILGMSVACSMIQIIGPNKQRIFLPVSLFEIADLGAGI